MWRVLAFLVFAFWAVMATLLVRVTYFPEDSRFAQLPPRAILKKFLDQMSNASTLHLYHNGVKVGHVFVSSHLENGHSEGGDYSLQISGLLEKGAVQDVGTSVSWRIHLMLLGAEHWGGGNGQVRMQDSGSVFDFNWPQDQSRPKFTLRKGGEIVADDKLLQMMMPGTPPEANGESMIKVKAREGMMRLAGQKRKGYVLELSIMDQHHIKAFFTEVGELAYAELPGGYRALEPVMHGLVPDEPEVE